MRWFKKIKSKHLRKENIKREDEIADTACGFLYRPGTSEFQNCVLNAFKRKAPDYVDPSITADVIALRATERQRDSIGGSIRSKNAEYDAWLQGPQALTEYKERQKRYLAGLD